MPGIPESEVFWFNVTNIGLGLATLACVGVAAWAVVHELLARARRRVRVRDTWSMAAFTCAGELACT